MKINLAAIKPLNPCQDRLNNYTEHYESFDGSLEQFFDLDKITHTDKLWVAFRLLPKNVVVECAARFAESVLHIYESKYPNDDRPRKAIEAARSEDAYAAANAANAADDAADDAANAAYAATNAANAAYAATNAAYAAADAAYAADAAAHAADAAADASYAADAAAYEKQQLVIVLTVVKEML